MFLIYTHKVCCCCFYSVHPLLIYALYFFAEIPKHLTTASFWVQKFSIFSSDERWFINIPEWSVTDSSLTESWFHNHRIPQGKNGHIAKPHITETTIKQPHFTACLTDSILVTAFGQNIMISTVCAVAFLCLLPVSRSAPLTCEQLVRPLDRLDPRHLEGKWALVAGSLSHAPFLERFRQRDSASINFPNSMSDTSISYTRSIRLHGNCTYSSYNITLEGSSFTFDGTDKRNLSAVYVDTSCRDCLLMRMDVELGKRVHFYLFSRRRQLGQEELEEFRAQVECLNMPSPVVMDPAKELCPDEWCGQNTESKKKFNIKQIIHWKRNEKQN